jgi:hypothetical protein
MKNSIRSGVALAALMCAVGCPSEAPALKPPPANVAAVDSGVAVALVLDTSGSMSGDKLAAVKKIARGTIASKLGMFSLSNNLDVAIVECGESGASVLLEMSKYDPETFDATIAGLNSGNGTPHARSFDLAFGQLGKSRLNSRHIFVLSDGSADDDVGFRLQKLKGKGLDTVKVHVIGFKTDAGNYTPFKREAKASVFMADDDAALEEAMSKTFKVILQLEAGG